MKSKMPIYLSWHLRICNCFKKMRCAAPLFLLFTFLFAAQVSAQSPFVSKAVAFAVSDPVTSFGVAKPEPGKIVSKKFIDENEPINNANKRIIKEIIPGLGGEFSLDMQRNPAPVQNIASPIASFEGNSSQDNANAYGGRVYPPDVNGDVGPNHYVQTTNLLVGIYNKTTGALVVPKFKMSTLFASLGPPFSTTDSGDPIVLYDQLADRWLISQFLFTSVTSGVYYQVIAISQTGDPTGAYHLYAFLMPNNKLNDYPHFGVWPDGYYMADNQFTNGGSFSGAGAFAFDRAKMLVGDPTASFIYFDQFASCPTCGGQLPTDLDGLTPPPLGTPNLFMEFRANEFGDPYDGLRIFAFHADFATPANSTFTQVGADLPLVPFDARGGFSSSRRIEQPPPSTSTSYLDGLTDRLMFRLAYRVLPGGVQSIVGNFTVNVSGVNPTSAATYQAGIKWFELRRNGAGVMSVNNEGVYAPGAGDGATGRNVWMASIAQDGAGNIGLGFSASSTTMFPSILYTGRLATDPPGMMSQGENTLISGTGVQLGTAGRWGDYSSMSIDTDECTFWYTQEYYTAASQASSIAGWLTRIGSFSLNSCITCTPPVVTAPTVTQPTCITTTGTIVVNATGSGTLEYSMNNGSTYQASNTFSNLVPASYSIKVRVQGSPDCVTAYAQNPVLLVSPIPPTAVIAVGGPLEFCQGGSVDLYSITEHYLKVLIPQNLTFSATTAVFGPAVSLNAVNGAFVYIPDGTASYLGCNPYAPGALAGKVALIDRGTCTFVLKVKNAQNAGAVGVIIVNNNANPPVTMGGSDPTVTIPVVMISQADGLTIKNLIANGLVNGMSFSPNTYLWSNGATTQNITATQTAVYSVTITNPAGCQAELPGVQVTVNQLPTCSINSVPSDAVYTGGVSTNLYLGYGAQSTTLEVTASGDGPFTYSWTGAGLSNYNTSNPVFTPTAEGSFTFTVEVTNSKGCKKTCSITICVLDIREKKKNGSMSGKVFICHAPPLTPTNVQTLSVSPNAVPEHLMDHPGDRLGKCTDVICGSNLPFTTFSEAEVETQTDGFSVKVSPNPSSSGFSIQVISNSNLPVTVRVLDAAGVVRSTSSNLIKGSVVRVGSELKNGTYFAEVIQGDSRKIVKLIKTN